MPMPMPMTPSVTELEQFLNFNISQGSVATLLRYGGNINDHFVATFLLSLTAKELFENR